MLKPFFIGNIEIKTPLALAPMAGVTDRPFRQLCKDLGAGMAASEMTTSDPRMWHTQKSVKRMDHEGETDPIIVQIAGSDPVMLAQAARFNVEHGAQIIDINMGCPAKKVCNVYAGSALLQDEPLVEKILRAVVASVDVPITLKIRTGWNRENKNGVRVAMIAQDCGIKALAVHGRTRADLYNGDAEYETMRAIKAAVQIPVLANGDLTSPEKARAVLLETGCDALMIGRAAQGRPWVFRELAHFFATGEVLPAPSAQEVSAILRRHLENLYAFYGEYHGVRMARKHIGWYAKEHPERQKIREILLPCESAQAQLALTAEFFA
jgi:tRNA-dihydrouridine synthase B